MYNEMEKLLMEQEELFQEIRKGNIVNGVILLEKNDEYYVDINYKTEGVLPKSEVSEEENLQVGDSVKVKVMRIDKNSGEVLLSKTKAESSKLWNEIMLNKIIDVKVVDKNDRGLIATYKGNLKGFIPLGHVELSFIDKSKLNTYIGEEYDVEVIDFNPEKRRLILSRKSILEQKKGEMKKVILDKMEKENLFTGVIKDIKDYGLFVDLNGLIGLVHLSELSWNKNASTANYKVGDKVDVKILSFDTEKDKLSLSIKALTQDPWNEFVKSYNVEDVVSAEIKNVKEYGVFVKLNDVVDGFVHISNLSEDFIKHPNDVVNIGDNIDLEIIKIDVENKKIELKVAKK